LNIEGAAALLDSSGASGVRAIPDNAQRPARRVVEWLRALGLKDEARLVELASEIVDACPQQAMAVTPEAAVALAQQRYETYLHELFGDRTGAVDSLWLRSFFEAHPAACLAAPESARGAVQLFGDPFSGSSPKMAEFRVQALLGARVPRWLCGLLPPVLLCGVAVTLLTRLLAERGLTWLEVGWVCAYAVLFLGAAIGFFTALYGFLVRLGSGPPELRGSVNSSSPMTLPRSALVMPIYHEDSEQVFAAVAAMREELSTTPGGEAFEIFVLSDSRDPERAADEERAFRRVAGGEPKCVPVYYRRRARNDRQKAGNIAEFFERWGDRYTYAVVLDADSLMRAATLVELVRRMERHPKLALLQAPLTLHRGSTWLARAHQFAASTTGPLFTWGLSWWAREHGNYYGHNAIVRVQAFLDCCALPTLAGEPPLGGNILSHDFVEAALLCRAGWQVRIAPDLNGSFEELPPTLPEYIARDRRWCQGNLQHLRIALAQGLAPMSRIHMLVGAGAYISGLVWVVFVGVGALLAGLGQGPASTSSTGLALLAATVILLVGPRLLGLLDTVSSRERRRAHGGVAKLVASALVELVYGMLLGPLLALHHARIVLSIVFGQSVRWGSQRRQPSTELTAVVRSELLPTCVGVASALCLQLAMPTLLLPLAPAWLPLVLAIPLSLAVSSVRFGSLARRLGIFAVPSELHPDELSQRAEDLRAVTLSDDTARFRDLILDPVLMNAQTARLQRVPVPVPVDVATLERLRQRVLRAGPAVLGPEERRLLVSDCESLRWLHREAWRHWPVESWQLGRDLPQLPPVSPTAVATKPWRVAPRRREGDAAVAERRGSGWGK
jgi:membrane glycosyltransferase